MQTNNNQTLIHFKLDAQTHLESLGLKYQETGEELDVIVNEQLCKKLGINYDLVNSIEAVPDFHLC